MSESVEVVSSRESVADPSLTRAIGLHHTLPTAIADLVDNSLDACAEHILVRFVREGTRITGLKIIDDGKGMDAAAIDAAMTYGNKREYASGDLGHFGVGMKAASLSQANTLVVWSKSAGGDAVGRTIESSDHMVSTVKGAEAQAVFESTNPRFPFTAGTIVEWRGITTFLMSADEDEQVSWLETAIDDVRSHLGVVFHRILDGSVRMTVDVFDVAYNRAGPPRVVRSIDPFAYPGTGRQDYPRTSTVELPSGTASITCHIWPARSSQPEYRLFGAPGRDRQGLYFYRHRRLLQVGGWNGLWHARPDYGPARVAIDLDDAWTQHVQINPEKSGVTLDATVSAALRSVLAQVVADAVSTTKSARTRTPKPITALQPSSGFPEDVLDSFSDAFTFDDGQEPVAMQWRVLKRDRFFEVDLKNRTLWINARFRTELLGKRSRDNTDAPIVKALLYLLVHQMFTAQRLSGRQIEQMKAWQDVLVSAMSAHREKAGGES
ncbi:ATP-binding protein [Rhodococcus sp. Eu-32]|uniref:ATP-binding protein n=1 Tax=Rhodococcus sp. Eu-32 TaxID=1017319 RepID=UPI000DF3D7D4|nr:ATP-binding protein [Rhodococcus sp. Eu-32]RRQ27503.1 ATP-binding protein [Rhodococcus sp. Eu-32]